MEIIVVYVIICFLVALTGRGKKIGYGGVFLLSLILSPLIGLIIGLVSAEAKQITRSAWNCGKCGFALVGMPETCSNCNAKIPYPATAYDKIKYTCTNAECKKQFFGRRDTCPHCNKRYSWDKPEKRY